MHRSALTPFALVLALSACSTTGAFDDDPFAPPALRRDLGTHHRQIKTESRDAQRYFDQGLVFAYAFNHDAAEKAFLEAARHDPECAMAWWGVALVNGPHINNNSMDERRSERAYEAAKRARKLSKHAGPIERELINALRARYSSRPPADRKPLDTAYADAMRKLAQAHPNDADIVTLCAEAIMDLHPWDLWTRDAKPKVDTLEIVGLLERALALAPDHPGANHLYVHAMEASSEPEKALPAADRLRDLVPGAGHLVHMPAHIDLRLGRYADASAANVRAIAADQAHKAEVPAVGFYRVYMAHNHHFLAFSSMMEGKSATALETARQMVKGVPPEFIRDAGPLVDGYVPIVFHVLVRFGRWQDVLAEPAFEKHLVVANSIRHYARGVALTALGRVDEAEREAEALATTAEQVGPERTVGNSPARDVVEIARNMLAGEIAFRRGRTDDAIALMRKAVELEDGLVYDEPPDWMMPTRHALGAALMQAGRFEEAEQAYREDLERFPDNGWSLFGLARSLDQQHAPDRAREAMSRFETAWARADVELKSSCFCQPGM